MDASSSSSASGSASAAPCSSSSASGSSSSVTSSSSSASGSASVDQLPRNKYLPDDHRFGAYIALRALSKDREVEKKDKELVADLLKTSVRTVERIWKVANEQVARGEEVDLSNKKKGRSGRQNPCSA